MEKCSLKRQLELILHGEPGVDYVVEELKGKFHIRVLNEELREVYGGELYVPGKQEIILISLFTFIEDRADLLEKLANASKKFLSLENVYFRVYLNDCDTDTVTYIKVLHKVLTKCDTGLSVSDVLILAHKLTSLLRHSDVVRDALKGEITEQKYFRYQISIEKIAYYLKDLTTLLGSTSKVSEIIDVIREIDTKNYYEELSYLAKLFSSQHRMELVSIREAMKSCEERLVSAVNRLLSHALAQCSYAYLVVPAYLYVALFSTLNECDIVVIPR